MESNQSTQSGASNMDRSGSSSQVVDELNMELIKSVLCNDINKVKVLLKSGADVNIKGYGKECNYAGDTPLILAANKNYFELFKALLQTPGIKINEGNKYGKTAFHTALDQRHRDIAKLLLEKKETNINAQDNFGSTPLILAAYNGDEELVEKLLEKPGILINKKDMSEQTALHKSVQCGHMEVLKILLNVPGILVNEKDNIGQTPLHLAADSDLNQIALSHQVGALEVLLGHRDINVNVKDKYGQTALHTSAFHGNLKVVKKLLNAGANVEEKTSDVNNSNHIPQQGRTAAQWAEHQGHTDVVEAIKIHIEQGGATQTNWQVNALNHRMEQVGISGGHPSSGSNTRNVNDELLSAAKSGDFVKVKELLKFGGTDVNCKDRYDKNTPLHLASEKGHLEIVQALLEARGIEVNAKNKDNTRFVYPVHLGDDPNRAKVDEGKTALYLAVTGKHLEVVRSLVNDMRTDVNAKDKYGKSLLQMAVRENAIQIVELLLTHPKIDVNVADRANDHFTPLHVAAESGYSEIVDLLLKHPTINVNPKDKYYECTPLHLAVRGNKLGIVKAILNHPKCNPSSIAKYDKTPLHDAAENGYQEILEALIHADANANAKDRSGSTPRDLAEANKHLSTAFVLKQT